MNGYILSAGVLAALTTLGHFFVGSPQFLKPMLAAAFDEIPKKVMHCVFHYVSVYLILSTAALLLIGFGVDLQGDPALLIRFIALHYTLFAVWQIVIAVTSSIPNGIFKLFQWIFFTLIAILSWIGA